MKKSEILDKLKETLEIMKEQNCEKMESAGKYYNYETAIYHQIRMNLLEELQIKIVNWEDGKP